MTEHIPGKWRTLIILAVAELLAMAVWFSASAVVPALTETWSLDPTGQAWLTISVQLGFVVGALGSALLNLADRVPAHRLFSLCALLAGTATVGIPLFASGLATALGLRLITGILLAGVYPVGMKLMAGWTRQDRGLGIGLLVGALTVGSASPHLLSVLSLQDWRPVLYLASASAILAALVALLWVRPGPFTAPAPPFDWRQVGQILRRRDLVLTNIGYLGHMWELYAMWAWIPLFLLASFETSAVNPVWARLVAFAAISIGGLGSFIAGALADRLGRTRIAMWSLAVSGGAAITVGPLFGRAPLILVCVTLIWGFAVVADSAQYSAAMSELSPPHYVGTALTLQTSLGFLLTLFTIQLVPLIQEAFGWRVAFLILVPGPIAGLWAMAKLRYSAAATRLAGGRG